MRDEKRKKEQAKQRASERRFKKKVRNGETYNPDKDIIEPLDLVYIGKMLKADNW